MNTDEAHRRAEALFKKEQQSHEAQQAMTEYEAELQAMREKTARLRALRWARDAVNQKMRTAPIRRAHKGRGYGSRQLDEVTRGLPSRRLKRPISILRQAQPRQPCMGAPLWLYEGSPRPRWRFCE